jgi:glucuronokinase
VAPARAALAGNPSDGYGGAVLAVALDVFGASAGAGPGPASGSGVELVDAAVARFGRELLGAPVNAAVSCSTTVPMMVGLGGSSAIVIATLRALCSLHGVSIRPAALAELALAVEVEDLGIVAGLQDRVAQAHGGLTFMEFACDPPRYESLDPALLPPLVVAWAPDRGEHSGVVHGDLRSRFLRGDPSVVQGMTELAMAARGARDGLLAGDLELFRRCVDLTYDVRASMLVLEPRHVEMIRIARAAGAAANYTGSGGAIVCACSDGEHREAVQAAFERAGLPSVAV